MNEPKQLRPGMTITWTESVSDYPPSAGWTLRYTLTDTSNAIIITTTTSGDGYLVTLTPSTLRPNDAAITAGFYRLYGYVEKGTGATLERHEVSDTVVEVLPYLEITPITGGETLASIDTRTHARKMLDAIEALMLKRATKAQASYQIAGRALSFLSPKELRMEYERWKRKVDREEGTNTGKILPRFGPIT